MATSKTVTTPPSSPHAMSRPSVGRKTPEYAKPFSRENVLLTLGAPRLIETKDNRAEAVTRASCGARG